jgi:hypothetical protein
MSNAGVIGRTLPAGGTRAKTVVAHKEDFSRHNPIDRWWGGTHLTNDRRWCWNPALTKPFCRQSERGVP